MDKNELFEIFMKYGIDAILAYGEDNLEQYLISQDVSNNQNLDLGDFDDDEFGIDYEEFEREVFNILNVIRFNQDQLRKIGVSLEDFIDNPGTAYLYARDVIKGRWPEGEKIVLRNADAIVLYARDVIKGRWPEGEKELLDILGRSSREDVIEGGIDTLMRYAENIIGGRWPEGEEAILDIISRNPVIGDFGDLIEYSRSAIGGRWPEGEKIMLDIASKDPNYYRVKSLMWYASDIIGGRWPEAEDIILPYDEIWDKYIRMVGDTHR